MGEGYLGRECGGRVGTTTSKAASRLLRSPRRPWTPASASGQPGPLAASASRTAPDADSLASRVDILAPSKRAAAANAEFSRFARARPETPQRRATTTGAFSSCWTRVGHELGLSRLFARHIELFAHSIDCAAFHGRSIRSRSLSPR